LNFTKLLIIKPFCYLATEKTSDMSQLSSKIYYFIVNPNSGSSQKIGLIRQVTQWLESHNFKVEIRLTKSLSHTTVLVDQAKACGATTVVAVGGDGTVRAVVAELAGTQIPLLIIPTGNENLLAREIGLDGRAERCIQTLEHGRVRQLDIARINDDHFMAVAGIGFDGEVIRRLHRTRRGHVDSGDYIWPICRIFWEYVPPRFQVVADGEVFDQQGLVLVGNISRYAAGLAVLAQADGFDGWLDLAISPYRYRLGLLGHAFKTVVGRGGWDGSVIRRRYKKIRISSSQSDIPVEIDGDPGPSLPLEIEVLPGSTRILVPPEAK
jgi:diacylglycerol kinase (ATP)